MVMVISDSNPASQTLDRPPPVVLFGGTFDPIHFGHLRAAVEVRERLNVDALHLLPCHIPGHRDQPDSDTSHRSNMIRLAIASDDTHDETGLLIDLRECAHSQPSYTVNTLLALREEIGQNQALIVTLGMDSFNALPQWHRWEELLSLAHLLVLKRPDNALAENETIAELLKEHVVTRLDDLKQSACGGIWVEEITPLAISATKIRRQISQGLSARYLLPDTVWSYIKTHSLYGYDP